MILLWNIWYELLNEIFNGSFVYTCHSSATQERLKYLQKVLPFEAMSLDSKQIDVLYIDIYLLDMFQKTLRQIMNGLIFGFQVNKPYQILKLASGGNGHFTNHILWKNIFISQKSSKNILIFQRSLEEYVVSQKPLKNIFYSSKILFLICCFSKIL